MCVYVTVYILLKMVVPSQLGGVVAFFYDLQKVIYTLSKKQFLNFFGKIRYFDISKNIAVGNRREGTVTKCEMISATI